MYRVTNVIIGICLSVYYISLYIILYNAYVPAYVCRYNSCTILGSLTTINAYPCYQCIPTYTHVYPRIPTYTHVYPCIPRPPMHIVCKPYMKLQPVPLSLALSMVEVTALLTVLSHKIWTPKIYTPRSIFCKNIWTPGTNVAEKSVPYHKICSPGGALYYDKYGSPLKL